MSLVGSGSFEMVNDLRATVGSSSFEKVTDLHVTSSFRFI